MDTGFVIAYLAGLFTPLAVYGAVKLAQTLRRR